MYEIQRHWHHSPLHLFVPNTMYIVTASTLYKRHFFHNDAKLCLVRDALFEVANRYDWQLQAWAVFSNHYHFIAKSPDNAKTLKPMIQRLHSPTARYVNNVDGDRGRQVWFQYWDTCLTFERSYLARLNYVHHNPVRHGLVAVAEEYPYCSAGWFKTHAEPAFLEKVKAVRYDQVNVVDDFDVEYVR